MRLFFWTEGMFYSFLLDFSPPSGTIHKMKTLEIRSGMGKLLSCSCCTCTFCAQYRRRAFWDRQWNMCILQFYEKHESFPSARGFEGELRLDQCKCVIQSLTQPLDSLTRHFGINSSLCLAKFLSRFIIAKTIFMSHRVIWETLEFSMMRSFWLDFFRSLLQFNEIVCWCAPKCRNISRTKSSLASHTKPICLILLIRTNGMNNSFYLMFLRLLQPIYHKIKTHKNFGEAENLSTRHDMQMICSFGENWLFLSNFLYSTSRNCNDDSSNACKLFLVAQWNILQPNMMKLSAVSAMHETKKIAKSGWLRFCPTPSYYAAFSWPRFNSNFLFHKRSLAHLASLIYGSLSGLLDCIMLSLDFNCFRHARNVLYCRRFQDEKRKIDFMETPCALETPKRLMNVRKMLAAFQTR